MRTLILALLTGMLSMTAEAKHRSYSQLNIHLNHYGNYTVMFNNTTYFATERVRIFNIPPGKHYVRIMETMQPRYHGSRAMGRRLIYEGYVTIPPASRVVTMAGRGCGLEVARIDRFDGPRGNAYGYYKKRDKHDDDRYKDYEHKYDRKDHERYNDDDRDYEGGSDYNYDGGQAWEDDGTYGDSRLVGQPANNKRKMETDNLNKKK